MLLQRFTSNIRRWDFMISCIVFLMVLLWVYTATSKLADLADFKRQLSKQNFGPHTASLLFYFIPSSEILAALLLCFRGTRLMGFYLSFILMLLFTGYIGLVLINYYGHVPCSCGGVLKHMGWQAHFIFNIFFLMLAGVGIVLTIKTRPPL